MILSYESKKKIAWPQLWRIYSIQDGGQLKISSQNISPNKADMKIL